MSTYSIICFTKAGTLLSASLHKQWGNKCQIWTVLWHNLNLERKMACVEWNEALCFSFINFFYLFDSAESGPTVFIMCVVEVSLVWNNLDLERRPVCLPPQQRASFILLTVESSTMVSRHLRRPLLTVISLFLKCAQCKVGKKDACCFVCWRLCCSWRSLGEPRGSKVSTIFPAFYV